MKTSFNDHRFLVFPHNLQTQVSIMGQCGTKYARKISVAMQDQQFDNNLTNEKKVEHPKKKEGVSSPRHP
jgi:hypothetical protein